MKNTLPWFILTFCVICVFFISFVPTSNMQVVYQLKGRLFHKGKLIKGGYYLRVFDGEKNCINGESKFESLKVIRNEEFFVYDITLDNLGRDDKEGIAKASNGDFWLKILTHSSGKAELDGLFIKFIDSRKRPKFVLDECDKEIEGIFEMKGDTILIGDLKL